MQFNKRLPQLVAILLVLAGLGLAILAFFSYDGLKTLLDSLVSDGEFQSLNPGNMVVFRGIFLTGFLVMGVLAYLFAFRRWGKVGAFLKQLWADARRFFASLRFRRDGIGFFVAVLVITGLAVIYRLEFIYSSLHHDEAYTYMAFAHSLRAAITDYHLPNNHVFHSILVYFSTRLLGDQPWVVRLPALTAGVLAAPAAYVLAKRFYSRWVGLAAALLAALSPALIDYSTNARGYSLVALFALVTLILGDMVLREKNLFAWALISVFSALGFYTVPVMLMPFGVLFVWMFLENQVAGPGPYRSKWEFLRYWLFCGLSAAALTLVLYLPILLYSGPEKLFSNQFVAPAAWEDVINVFSSRFSRTWAEWVGRVPAVVVILLGVGVILGVVFHKRISSRRVPLQLAALLWLTVLVLVERPQAGAKIWLFLNALVLIWAAAGLVGLLEKVRIRSVPVAAILVGGFLVWGIGHAYWLAAQLTELWSVRGDEESALVYAQEQLAAGDEIVVAPPDDAAVWYYAELHGVDAELYRSDSTFDRLLVLVNPGEGQTLESVVDERGPGSDFIDPGAAQLLQTFGKLQVFVVPGK